MKPATNPDQEDQLVIVGMKRNEENKYKYYTILKGKGVWVDRQFLIEKHPDELCKFYEDRISFNEDC